MSNARRATAFINLNALRHNLARVRELAPGRKVMAVVKADAYGHGLAAAVGALDGADAFAVATLDEGVACRALTAAPVTVLSGLLSPASLAVCARHRLSPVLHSPQQLDWMDAHDGEPLDVWLKIDSGMNRLGVAPADADAAVGRLRRNRRVGVVRLMSHLANADDAGDDLTAKQCKVFTDATDSFNCERSLANSAGIARWRQTHLDWVRPGIMLYGASPFVGGDGAQLNLRPAMTLTARLLAVKDLPAGSPVGYGGAFVTRSPMRVGIVGFGYADGYPRVFKKTAPVSVGGVRATVIGRVAMDMTTIDLTGADADAGDEVLLWGGDGDGGVGVDEVARAADTIAYELLCKVGARVARVTA